MMRIILLLSALLTLGGQALASEIMQPDPSRVATHVRTAPGSTILTVTDDSASPFGEPRLHLVALPPGARAPQLRVLASDDGSEAPDIDAELGAPMIMRGLRLVPVTITSRNVETGKAAGDRPRTVQLDIRYEEGAAATTNDPAALRYSRGFFTSLRGKLPEEQMSLLSSTQEGSYVIVTDPNFLSAVEPFAAWKRAQGFEVVLATTDETGRQSNQIHNFVSNLYHNSPRPPQYLLLVGDAPDGSYLSGIPGYDYHQIISDHPYSMMDGDDFLPDLHVGRMSVRSPDEARTIIAKTLRHEQDPYVDGDTSWYSRGLVVAADYGSVTPRPVCRWVRQQMLEIGMAQVDSVFYPPWFADPLRLIPNAINQGLSVVAYRGWAYGIHGWEPPHFTDVEVAGLTNTWKLPVVFSFVCQNNDFREPTCFGEAWIRAGSAAAPRGAVAFIGNSEPWSHTRFNDVAAIGAFNAIRDGATHLGDILTAFKMEWLAQFPTEIPYEGSEKESVEFYFHMYNLLGDPDLELWTAPPVPVQVTHAQPIPLGSNFIDVSVRTAAGDLPVAGARVGVSQNAAALGMGWTDSGGMAHVPANFLQTQSPVVITVSGAGVKPYTGTTTVSSAGAFLSIDSISIDDDASGASHGNGDGVPNPGEILELTVTLRNQGGAPADAVAATLAGAAGFEVTGQSASFGTIAAGQTATSASPFVVAVSARAENNLVGRLPLDAASGVNHSVSDLTLAVTGADPRAQSFAIEDADGVLSPGEQTNMSVTLVNDGAIASGSMSAILRSLSPELVTIADSTASYVSLDPSGSGVGDAAFVITAAADAAIGAVANMKLLLTSIDGAIAETPFSITVGAVDHSAPLGPDGYGYYAYDITDTDYPDVVPTFGYVNVSPAYGGSGTKLNLGNNKLVTVDLPFPFTYYGNSYSRIVVSDNGWISFDTSSYYDFYNWHMPNAYGNGAQVSAFWDNLDPTKTIDGRDHRVPLADGIYVYSDAANHRYIIEWSRIPNFFPDFNDVQTFELILYDPAYHATATGDGMIDVQYKQITNNDAERMYATVGIENMAEDTGIEYTYSNLYPAAASPLASGLVIRFTTERPRFNPPGLASFHAEPTGNGVALAWEPKDDRPMSSYRIYRSDPEAGEKLVSTAALDRGARSFIDESADPGAPSIYTIGWIDPYGRQTEIGPFYYLGRDASTLRLALDARTKNPSRGPIEFTYTLPADGEATLRVHDLTGRLLRTLVSGGAEKGRWGVTWDGRDDAGHDLPSGIYLCRLTSGKENRSLKVTLVR